MPEKIRSNKSYHYILFYFFSTDLCLGFIIHISVQPNFVSLLGFELFVSHRYLIVCDNSQHWQLFAEKEPLLFFFTLCAKQACVQTFARSSGSLAIDAPHFVFAGWEMWSPHSNLLNTSGSLF